MEKAVFLDIIHELIEVDMAEGLVAMSKIIDKKILVELSDGTKFLLDIKEV